MGIEVIRLPEPVNAPVEQLNSPAAQQKEAASKMHDEVMGKPKVPGDRSGSDSQTCKPGGGHEAREIGDGASSNDPRLRGGAARGAEQSKGKAAEKGQKELEFTNPYEKR